MTRAEEAVKWLQENYLLPEVTVLGMGEEAVILTDRVKVYKYFTDWEPLKGQVPGPEVLVSRLSKQRKFKTLYPVSVEWRNNELPLFIYPFEDSVPYTGGMETDLITFLKEATESGFVMSNVHPDNFINTCNGLRLIDYGVSFHPWTEEGFLHMARRTWLTLHCYNRGDLKSLMRKALKDHNLTELIGFEEFLGQVNVNFRKWSSNVLDKPPEGFVKLGQEVVLDSRIISIAMAVHPKTVFDYGCGKGKIAEAIAKQGVQVTAWDPDPEKIKRCISYGSNVNYLESCSDIRRIDRHFDVVICSIVGCIVESGKILELFADLRRLVSDKGRIVFSICNPFYTLEPKSELVIKTIPGNAHYRKQFEYVSTPLTTLHKINEFHRPWEWYKRKLNESGLRIQSVEESEGISPDTGWPHSDYIMAVLEPFSPNPVSLIIRACALESDTIDIQVRHIVRQLGDRGTLQQRIVAVDPRTENFPRVHGTPNLSMLMSKLNLLKDEGIIDEIIVSPEDSHEVANLNRRWFDLNSDAGYSANGQAVAATLLAVEHCRHDYIVAVDADVIIFNPLPRDPVAEAIQVLQANPNAITASLNIIRETETPWTSHSKSGPWRVEARAAVFRRDNLFKIRPLPNSAGLNALKLPWHRALDARILQSNYESYRGGDSHMGFIHPPNKLKWPREAWLHTLERVEAGFVPEEQFGAVDLVSTGANWANPKRTEPYVFVICGHNVQSGRIKRCLESLKAQRRLIWGAIVIDDASDNGAAEYTEILVSSLSEKITFIRNKIRKGSLANLHRAIHDFVLNPETVILTLDADDSLIGTGVVECVAKEYEKGADVTVGSMKRTDKEIVYPVCFDQPRQNRGGNVWQHLRTFKKYLFDHIREDDLKIDDKWIEMASDWAFMLPIIEMSSKPVHIPDQLYLYEPSTDKGLETFRLQREITIGKIIAKQPYIKWRDR
jgi:2-polyprenyl-3-methyl-5-hydroxy-6-metoxy-1,4-benzoquinol methylase